METVYANICSRADAMSETIRMTRRDLHRYAETGWLEIRTTALIAKRLTELGYEVLVGEQVCRANARMGLPAQEEMDAAYLRAIQQGADPQFAAPAANGFTGVIGILHCGEGPVMALRFDVDALTQTENATPKHFPYANQFASVNENAMHACGHDGHTAIGLAVAEILMALRDELHGTVKLIFQPAEEGTRGAKAIVEAGHLDDTEYVIAAHLCRPGADLSAQVGIGSGRALATTKFDVDIQGTPAHAGVAPQRGNNAMMAACTAALNMHAIPRHSGGMTRINVGRIVGGNNRNTVCGTARMEVEIRASTTDVMDYVFNYAKRIAETSAEMHGCTASITLKGAAPSSSNSSVLKTRIAEICKNDLGIAASVNEQDMSVSEDFAYMAQRVLDHGGQACYFTLPAKGPGTFHGDLFDFDESALPTGVKVFCGITANIMHSRP